MTFRGVAAGLAALALVGGLAGCGGSGSGSDPAGSSTSAGGSAGPVAGSGATTSTAAGSSTSAGSATTTTAASGLADASEAQRSAPGDGTGTALLSAVRVGRNKGFERIVFQFAGTPVPGYRVQWVDGPITADGSGEPVEVTGQAYLEIVLEPASGVDLSAPQLTVVYGGPDRISVAGQTKVITDLVRTGDFENVLTWVAGATERVPFRVSTLSDPTRIAIDLAAPASP